MYLISDSYTCSAARFSESGGSLAMMSGVVGAFGITNLYEGRAKLAAWHAHLKQDPVAGPFIDEYLAAMQAFLSGRR